MRAHRATPTKIFYGWWVVAALFAVIFLRAGAAFYAMGVFVVPFQDEFGWSRGQISVALSLSALVSGLFGPLASALVGRVGARRLPVAVDATHSASC